MKHLYITLLLSGCFLFGNAQVNFVTTVFYNQPNNTLSVQIGLARGNSNCASVVAFAEVDFEMQWSADVQLISSRFIPTNDKLDAADYLTSGIPDNGFPNYYPSNTNGSRTNTINGETYQKFAFHRSTNLCNKTIQLSCGEIAPLFLATFQLTTPGNFNQYNYNYDLLNNANNTNYIVEFNDGTSAPLNNKKEILFVTSKTKSLSDLSGNSCNPDGTIKSTNTASLTGSPSYTNTYGAILPAVINLFDVKKQGTQTILNWSTSAEEFNKGFEIQRKVNGQFEAIGFVSSKATEGFSNQLQQYSFSDAEQFPGKTVYYRLKQMGYNGEEAFSEVRVLRNAGKLQTLIYPNPTAGNLHIVLPQDAGTNTIELTDYSGKRIRVWEKYNAPVLNISNLPKGFFTVFITNLQTGERTAEKVIVQ